MYKLLSQLKPQISDFPISENKSAANAPSSFLGEAVFAGGSFVGLEAAFGLVDGVIKTATGYCGGTVKKPTYREVCEGRTGHTEAVTVIYDHRKISYGALCDIFWETHDPTNRDYLNFGASTHQKSAIFYSNDVERKQAQESKIRRQMKLNRRIVTKIIAMDSDFYMAENQHQKFHLQKHYRLCASLSLRSTQQFVESNLACKLNGLFATDEKFVGDELRAFLETNDLPKQTLFACREMIEDLRREQTNRENLSFPDKEKSYFKFGFGTKSVIVI